MKMLNFAFSSSLPCSSTNSICRDAGASSTGKSNRLVKSLKFAARDLNYVKREVNSFFREATTLTHMSRSTSSSAQASRRGKLATANRALHKRSFTSKAVMCECMSVTKMSLPSSFTLRAFMCSVMSVRKESKATEPSRVKEMMSVGKISLVEKGGHLLSQVVHTGQHGSTTQPADLTEIQHVIKVSVQLVRQYLELVVIKERMELTTFITTDMTSTRLADLAHRDSWWMMQCTNCE